MSIRIDRCVCRKKTFSYLLERAREAGASTIDELAVVESFGDGCGLCKPYVRRMLETGRTEFNEIIAEERAAAVAAQQAQQRMMLLMFPMMFGMFSLFFPIGLVIYWVAQNVIGIVMQYFVTGWGGLRPQSAGLSGPRLGPTLTTAPDSLNHRRKH